MNKVKEIKSIAELMHNISDDLEFIIEILKALQTEEEIVAMKEVLEQSPDIVPAEIYDSLIKITRGRFEKQFDTVRYLKREYLRDPKKENFEALLENLSVNGIYSLAEWNLTDEEIKIMEGAESGDTVHIETDVRPALFTGEDDDTIYIYVYTSKIEIPKVRYSEYAIHHTSLNYIRTLVRVIKEATGKKIVLLLDYDSDECLSISDEVLPVLDSESNLEK